jgi:excinuclease ABC subunit C
MPLSTDLDTLPTTPGVYLMRDRAGDVLYVGKAVDLRARVKQYFGGGDGRFHVAFLVPRIESVEVVVTAGEREALLLEDTLIKKYQPRYNVKLKDDKSWLSVRLPVRERFPRMTLVRRWKDDGARYYGPFLDEINARDVVKLLTKTVPLRTCSDAVFRAHKQRPCIEHPMGRCAGPCAGLVDEPGYRALLDEADLLLRGKHRELQQRLVEKMEADAAALRFEAAAQQRDRVRLLTRLAERQTARTLGEKDRDAFALHREGDLAVVAMLPSRSGRLQDPRAFSFRGAVEDDAELLGHLIGQIYGASTPPPDELLVPIELPDAAVRSELLTELLGRKVRVFRPQRGEGVRLLELAAKNAAVRFSALHSERERADNAIAELQRRLRMDRLPSRIECYDNSNTQGTDPVSAMVTFRDGKPDKAGYRTFRPKTVEGPDDYATMREVLGRRLRRGAGGEAGWELPDLVLIDGGRGQLAMAVEAAREAGIGAIGPDGRAIGEGPPLRIVAIAKPHDGEPTDKIYEPGRKNAMAFPASSPALRLLQHARDEAHRFSVERHRGARSRRTLRSDLDGVPGIGAALRKRLLTHFGSVAALRGAEVSAIAAVPGIGTKRAAAIRAALGG